LAGISLNVLAFLSFTSASVHACTIFVLTDTNQALFCNNEDWSNPKTRIWFLPAGEVKFNLAVELKKGGHYYDMPQIHEQLAQDPRPLLLNMKRFLMDEFNPIPDKEPAVTTHVRAMIQDAIEGTMRADDFTAEMWKEVLPKQKGIQADVKGLGDFVSLTLVDRGDVDGRRSYRYRIKFKTDTVLQHFVFDRQNKLVTCETEDLE
jgi:hypothetical protein